MRRTKIVATVGPATSEEAMLKKLFAAGVDVVRLNFSHGTHADHGERMEKIRRVSHQMGRPIGILQDLCGPKIRCGKIDGDGMELVAGKMVEITKEEIIGKDNRFSSEYKELIDDVNIGDRVFLDDGLMELEVLSKSKNSIQCNVIAGGKLTSKKGINLPGTKLSTPSVTEKDKLDLKFGLAQGVDFVALSFVRRPEDIQEVKELIRLEDKGTPLVIAKIEKPEALQCIDEIIQAADGIMVARGDMGVEMKPEQVPPIQKELIRRCRVAGKPVITATQMLDSMIRNPRPTRAEVSDVANAVLEGTDAVMLSGESASGLYPLEAVEMMARICHDAELYMFQNKINEAVQPNGLANQRYEALASGVSGIAKELPVKFVSMFTQNGSSASNFSKFRFEPPILAFTRNDRTARQLCLAWGVLPITTPETVSEEVLWDFVQDYVLEKRLAKKGDVVVLTFGFPKDQGTNTIQINKVTRDPDELFDDAAPAIVTDMMTIRFDVRSNKKG